MFLIFADVPAYQVLDVTVLVRFAVQRGDDVRVVDNMELQMHASRDFFNRSACFIFALLIFHGTSCPPKRGRGVVAAPKGGEKNAICGNVSCISTIPVYHGLRVIKGKLCGFFDISVGFQRLILYRLYSLVGVAEHIGNLDNRVALYVVKFKHLPLIAS